ncbi:MAG: hypothetical protein XXXJIFNMEKO3_00609 [Candidatus Erwinia impunctatus]|nr:hypothetical protein XXXJIFNMEKO_00609 [Culicoides impunctatus]
MTSGQRGNLAPDNLIKPNMQNGSLPLSVADLLVNVSPQKRKVLLSIVMVRGLPNLTKPHIGNLSKPDIETAVMLTNVDIETARMMTNDDILTAFSCVREGERVSDGMKKGSTENAALCDLTTYNRVSRIYAVQPFGSMPKRSSSLRPRVFNQLARLMPEAVAAASNCAFSSGVTLILNCGAWPSPLGLLSLFIVDRWSPIELILTLIGGHLSTVSSIKTTPPQGITSTKQGLTATVIRGNSYGYQS